MCILSTLKKSWRWLIVDTEGGNSNFFIPPSPAVYCQVCSSAVYNHKKYKTCRKVSSSLHSAGCRLHSLLPIIKTQSVVKVKPNLAIALFDAF